MIHRMLCGFVQGRAFPRVLACTLALSMTFTCALIPTERAYASTAELTVGHRIEYGGYDTNAFSVNGFEAFCGDPGSRTPEAGSYETKPLQDRALAACLWYGFGGPGFDASLWPVSDWKGEAMADDTRRVASHVSLAYLASGSTAFAYGSCDATFKRWCDESLFAENAICGRLRASGFAVGDAEVGSDGLPEGFTAYAMITGTDTQVMYAMDHHPRGLFTIQKASSRPSLSDDNSCYALAGARFGVYADVSCTESLCELTTDERGRARSPELEPGVYYVKELAAPHGFALDPTPIAVTVASGGDATVRVADEPQSDAVGLMLRKVDAETGKGASLGAASLAGAEYTVRFFAGLFADAAAAEASGALRRTWILRTDENGELRLSEEAKVSGDEFYRDAEYRPVLPLGTVTVQESAPPTGYLLDEKVHVLQVTADGSAPFVNTYAAPLHGEQVVRGDLGLIKIREADQHRLAGIPFRLSSLSTGEAHIIVTDENGVARTGSDKNPHAQRTNANDAAVRADGTIDETLLDAEAGVWFGTDDPHDGLGALPYDVYSLAELPVSANDGLELVELPAVTIARHDTMVDLGTVVDRLLAFPAVRTTARDGLDGDKTVAASEDAVIVDRVNCTGLTPGAEYRVIGRLVQRSSGDAVHDADHAPVTAETMFLADSEQAVVELSFPFDASAHADSDLVVFETLEDRSIGEAVVVESNLDEYEQTVHVLPAPMLPSKADAPAVHFEEEKPLTMPASVSGLAATGDATDRALLTTASIATLVLISAAATRLVRTRRPAKRRLYRERLRWNDL